MNNEKLTYSILTAGIILMNCALYYKHNLANFMLGLVTFSFILVMDYYIFFMENK